MGPAWLAKQARRKSPSQDFRFLCRETEIQTTEMEPTRSRPTGYSHLHSYHLFLDLLVLVTSSYYSAICSLIC
jgi:hypothetical protein